MRKWLAIFGTLLIAVLGYFMPQVIVKTLDKPSEYVYDLKLADIKYANAMTDELKALENLGVYTVVEVNEGGTKTKLTSSQAVQNAKSILGMLEKYSLVRGGGYEVDNCKCEMRIAGQKVILIQDYYSMSAEDFARIVWNVKLSYGKSTATLVIDDKTGKMTELVLENSFINSDKNTNFQYLAGFLESYFDELDFTPVIIEDNSAYAILAKDNDGAGVQLNVNFINGALYFNTTNNQ